MANSDFLLKLNQWLEGLTGCHDFVLVQPGDPNIEVTSQLVNNHLQVRTPLDPSFYGLHEFGHFIAAEDADLLAVDYHLNQMAVPYQCYMEARAGAVASLIASELRDRHRATTSRDVIRHFIYHRLNSVNEPLSEIENQLVIDAWRTISGKTHWGHKEFVVKRAKQRLRPLSPQYAQWEHFTGLLQKRHSLKPVTDTH